MNLQNAHKEMIEWMTAFGQECPKEPCYPHQTILYLRERLISEEALETSNALDVLADKPLSEETTYQEVIDGCGDLLFVTIGTLVALGVDTQAVWNEILKSNWTKFWTWLEIQKEFNSYDNPYITHIEHENKNLSASRTFKSDNKEARNWLVKNHDEKVIKSPSFTPPNLQQFIPKELL